VTTIKTIRNRVARLEQTSTSATRFVWIDEWENADSLISEMLASGEISSADEVALVGWREASDQTCGGKATDEQMPRYSLQTCRSR
jgi:hypothetical protein